jgi:hypothetical protein
LRGRRARALRLRGLLLQRHLLLPLLGLLLPLLGLLLRERGGVLELLLLKPFQMLHVHRALHHRLSLLLLRRRRLLLLVEGLELLLLEHLLLQQLHLVVQSKHVASRPGLPEPAHQTQLRWGG